jgi:hypothetical protein
MTSKRLHLLLLSVIGLLLIALVGGAYLLNSALTKKGETLTNLKAQTMALQQEQDGLKKAKKQVAAYADLEKVTRAIVPEDKSQAEAVREIVKIAGANKITLSSITFPASTLGNSTAPKSSATAAKTATPVNQNSTANKLSQLQAVPNIPGVYLLEITLESDQRRPVTYNQFISFLDGLEKNRRTSQVSGITLQPDTKNRSLLNFTLTINGYIKP